ncbi:conserved hypothetical protein [Candidatus Zixiibacteriota bacterium]|nr:conserved hypothetical protein [candidate division Zixibacteria bacterium]
MAVVNCERPIISFLSDFGLQDNYVGIVKGVIAKINPRAEVIDLTHDVPPYNIRAGKYLLETAYESFPAGTIHLAVVDPGVGMKRKGIIIETGKYFFVGPDNGLFSFLAKTQIKRVYSLNRESESAIEISNTFHARDIFGPAAAYLSLGGPIKGASVVGKRIIRLQGKAIKGAKGIIAGRVIYIDHFGNLVTSLRQDRLPHEGMVFLNDILIGPVKKTFGSVGPGKPVCYVNSFGYLEIAVREGSAAAYFAIRDRSAAKILIAPRVRAR